MNRAKRIYSTLKRNWQRTHAVAAPFGTAITTLLISARSDSWVWLFWSDPASWGLVADNTGAGAVVYGVIALTIEGGATVVFWSADEWDKRKERRNAERKQQLAEAEDKGRKSALDAVRKHLELHPGADPLEVIRQVEEATRDSLWSEPASADGAPRGE